MKKNSPDGLNGRIEMTEERTSELNDRPLDIIQYEQREKIGKKSEQSLGNLWENNKNSKIHIIGIQEGEEKEC